MEPTSSQILRARARAFLAGDYPGAPIDYVMAIAIVLAMLAVIVVPLFRDILPGLGLTALTLLLSLLS